MGRSQDMQHTNERLLAGECFHPFASESRPVNRGTARPCKVDSTTLDRSPPPKEYILRARLILACVSLAIAGVPANAASRASHAPGDPLERINRSGFAIQMVLDRYVVGPVAKIYHALTPGPIRRAILPGILVNLSEPGVVVNDLLQARPARAMSRQTYGSWPIRLSASVA